MVQLSFSPILLLSLAWSVVVRAQDDRPPNANNYFISPPRSGYSIGADANAWNTNQIYTLGKPATMTWSTNYSSVAVTLRAEGNTAAMMLSPANSVKSFTWDGSLISAFDITSQPVFFLMLVEAVEYSNGGIGTRFFSHYFNITKAVVTSSSSISSSSTIRSSATGSATFTATGTATGTTASSSSSSSSSSTPVAKSNAAAIGGGVGGGIGGALVLIAAGVLFWKYRQTKKQNAMLQTAVAEQNMPNGAYDPYSPYAQQSAAEKAYSNSYTSPMMEPAELPSTDVRWELPAK